MRYKIIATHSGNFHLDELIAISVLKRHNSGLEIIRTREEDIFSKVDARVDVGEKYCFDTNDFDHHQKEGAGKRENGIEYASAGLIWKHFGRELCLNDESWSYVDKNLIQYVDLADNAKIEDKYGLQRIIGKIKSRQAIGESIEDCFNKALEFSGFVLENELISSNSQVKCNEKVRDLLKKSGNSHYIILDEPSGWEEVLVNESNKLFVIYQRDGRFRVGCVPKRLGTFNYRKRLPESWRGLKPEQLSILTGVSDFLFCHNDGFTAATKTLEGAIRISELAGNSD